MVLTSCNLDPPQLQKNYAFFGWTSSNSQLYCALWAEDNFVNKQLAVCCDTHVNRGTEQEQRHNTLLSWHLDKQQYSQTAKKNAQKLWSVQNVEQTAEAEGIWPTWSDQWTKQQPPYGFCWYLLVCLKFCLCETKSTWGKTQMNSNSFTDSDQKNRTTGAKTPLNRPEVYRWCTHKEQNNNMW